MSSKLSIVCITFLCLSVLNIYIKYADARRWKGAKKSSPPPPKPKDVRFRENQKLIAFDLDGTLWPFKAEGAKVPVKRRTDTEIVDKTGKKYTAFRDVAKILKMLQRKKYYLAAISQDVNKTNAEACLHEFQFYKFFTHFEIYPGPKTKHMLSLKEQTGLPAKNMLLFDDNEKETANVEKLNMTVVTVDKDGLTMDALNKGLQLLFLARHHFDFAE